jgi:X-X-X-Leu-X-X-Gly heptad repeat protein
METENRYPTVAESFARLHRAGWSIGETAGTTGWMVTGDTGENVVLTRGASQAEAWHRAIEQAEAVGTAAEDPRARLRKIREKRLANGAPAAQDGAGDVADGPG